MEQLIRAINDYVVALCRAITECREPSCVLRLLSQASSSLLDRKSHEEKQDSGAEAADGELDACRHSLAGAAAAAARQAGEPAPHLIRRQFFSSPVFQDLAEVLLTGKHAYESWPAQRRLSDCCARPVGACKILPVTRWRPGGGPPAQGETCPLCTPSPPVPHRAAQPTHTSTHSTPNCWAPALLHPPQWWRPSGCLAFRRSSGSSCLMPGSRKPRPHPSCLPLLRE